VHWRFASAGQILQLCTGYSWWPSCTNGHDVSAEL